MWIKDVAYSNYNNYILLFDASTEYIPYDIMQMSHDVCTYTLIRDEEGRKKEASKAIQNSHKATRHMYMLARWRRKWKKEASKAIQT